MGHLLGIVSTFTSHHQDRHGTIRGGLFRCIRKAIFLKECLVYTLLCFSACFTAIFMPEDCHFFAFLSHYYIVRQKSRAVVRFLFAKIPNFVPT
jgi:hypothetical protein